jgi:transcriptional regulator GlxA family with amidase domain
MPRKIVVLAVEDAQLLDVTGPFQCFASANDLRAADVPQPYEPIVVSLRGGLLRTSGGLVVFTRSVGELDGEAIDTLIVAGGIGTRRAMEDGVLIQALRDLAPRVRRLASVCTGAYLLAQAGLLDGRRAAAAFPWDRGRAGADLSVRRRRLDLGRGYGRDRYVLGADPAGYRP